MIADYTCVFTLMITAVTTFLCTSSNFSDSFVGQIAAACQCPVAVFEHSEQFQYSSCVWMPPKRKLKVDDTNDSIRSFCEDSILDGHVQHSLEMFRFLPTDAILTQVVGICTRVSTMIASL